MTPVTGMFEKIVEFIQKRFPGKTFIPLHEPRFVGKEKQYVLDAIDSTFVSSVGAYVNSFEKQIAELTGAKYGIAFVNGSSALHLALVVSGVKPGEEVLTQALTFIATTNAIHYSGAQPVFLDIDERTLGMSAARLQEFLTRYGERRDDGFTYNKISGKRIGACVPMHTFGLPCEIQMIVSICTEWNIPVVEDAAESLGSYSQGRHTGTFGLMGTFSFNGNKTITCGGGGAVVTNNEALAVKIKHLSTQAKLPHAWEFNHDAVGYNYRMPNLNAAMACAQLEQLGSFLENKRELASEYKAFFHDLNVPFYQELPGNKANYWLNAIRFSDLKERDAFLKYSNENGVMTRPAWTLMSKLPMFANCFTDGLECSNKVEQTLVNIPSSVRLNTL